MQKYVGEIKVEAEMTHSLTSMDKLIIRYIELTGITSPKRMSEDLNIPRETARTWLRRVRTNEFNHTGSISTGVQSQRCDQTQGGVIEPPKRCDQTPAPRVRAHKESSSKIDSPLEEESICAIDAGTTNVVTLPSSPRAKGKKPPSNDNASENEKAFEQFWSAFPSARKRGKGDCRQRFCKIVAGRAATADQIVKAVLEGRGIDPDYPPMPATWLNQGRWEDDPHVQQTTTQKSNGAQQSSLDFVRRRAAEYEQGVRN